MALAGYHVYYHIYRWDTRVFGYNALLGSMDGWLDVVGWLAGFMEPVRPAGR